MQNKKTKMKKILLFVMFIFLHISTLFADSLFLEQNRTLGNLAGGKSQNIEVITNGGYGIFTTSTLSSFTPPAPSGKDFSSSSVSSESTHASAETLNTIQTDETNKLKIEVKITNTKNEQENHKITIKHAVKKEKSLEKNNRISYNKIEQKNYAQKTITTERKSQNTETLHGSAFTQPRSTAPYYGIILSIIGLLFLLFNFHHHAIRKTIFSLREISR